MSDFFIFFQRTTKVLRNITASSYYVSTLKERFNFRVHVRLIIGSVHLHYVGACPELNIFEPIKKVKK